MIKKEDLVHGKQYKVTHEEGSTACLYWDGNSGAFCTWSNSSGIIYRIEHLVNIKEIPQADTLQEVVRWCKKNDKEVCIGGAGLMIQSDCFFTASASGMKPITIEDIRKPKYEEGAFYKYEREGLTTFLQFKEGEFVDAAGMKYLKDAMQYKKECFHEIELVYDWEEEDHFFYIKTI